MELILKNDVPNLGFKDDIVSVKNGYGRNFLIPQGLAILATTSSRKVLAENIKQREFREKKSIEEAQKLVKKLSKLEIKISAKSGSGDKLFGSISSSDLNSELANAGFDLDKKIIKVQGGTIKRLGSYSASLRLHRDVIHEISFEVVKSED
ncbi:MAG: 50S ribosomal protein L9 [Flavobacteriaceae bacterium]|jgi:large subunit ribosomal protein L9|nr:50S ribosomal protein L9 [Flavobacteriaceae bacterium]MBT3754272.1 50S ribosomal protein L9 [Flavobacteriaceae bacterium]MBT4246684.1 50S ribosomal protein L9 [Flavobacteriaceae bacterium]MBT4415695.1 50S ribosomal protein L9 [Flavobacteriaceae bacterium]MBT5396541.1 50S ribosomal protein L9 [Flavobacteriaceae bacterium]|tara:strand:+ start:647 stop:1099 length:453 start_codon:yes stop_codon:yes gene_type:complete